VAAPTAGVVTAVLVSTGELVSAGQRLVEVEE
jgi:biotin carboxyl carrier protein